MCASGVRARLHDVVGQDATQVELVLIQKGMVLQPGDVVELGIEGLGDQRQEVIQFNG